MQLSRDKILDAGLEILDAYGLGDLTMRRLATQLGVAPGALYWHFANKQALIESIARRILEPLIHTADATPAADEPPESTTAAAAGFAGAADWCAQLRETLLAHRDGAELVSAAVSMTSLHAELLDRLAAELVPGPDRQVGAATLLHFVLGAAVLEQSAQQAAETAGSESSTESADLPGGRHEFERGLAIILTGLAELASRR